MKRKSDATAIKPPTKQAKLYSASSATEATEDKVDLFCHENIGSSPPYEERKDLGTPMIEMVTGVGVTGQIARMETSRADTVNFLIKFCQDHRLGDTVLFRAVRFLDMMLFETSMRIMPGNTDIYGCTCLALVLKLQENPIDLRKFLHHFMVGVKHNKLQVKNLFKALKDADRDVSCCLQSKVLNVDSPHELLDPTARDQTTMYFLEIMMQDSSVYRRYSYREILDAVREIKNQYPAGVVRSWAAVELLQLLQGGAKIPATAIKHQNTIKPLRFGQMTAQVTPLALRPSIFTTFCDIGCAFINRSEYKNIKKLKEGAYGKVYLVEKKGTRQRFVIKDEENTDPKFGVPKTVLYEAACLAKLGVHTNIVTSYGMFIDPSTGTSSLVLERMDHDLYDHYRMYKLRLEHIKAYLKQILQGVAHIHVNGVIHRDLKPQNILYRNSDKSIKIADFGLAVRSQDRREMAVQTLWYRAPEVLLGDHNYGTAIDIWSVGCIFAEIAEKCPLFPHDREGQTLIAIFQRLGKPRELNAVYGHLTDWEWLGRFIKQPTALTALNIPILGPEGNDLLNKMLDLNPRTRITAEQALRHPFFG